MSSRKLSVLNLLLLINCLISFSQVNRNSDKEINEILPLISADNTHPDSLLMERMLSLGEFGLKQICDRVVPVGANDDAGPRNAVENFSRYLAQNGNEENKRVWEKICISYAVNKNDNNVKDFFMKQLQFVGGYESAEAMKAFLVNPDLWGPALAVINAVGGRTSEIILAESLKNNDLPCAAAVMNSLALMKSQLAVKEYIIWASVKDINIKAAAYNALAQCGSPLSYQVLLDAAKGVLYRWEHTGATTSLLNYAEVVGKNGDILTMDNICKLIIKKCNDNITIQNKITALGIYVSFHGIDAMGELIKAASHPNAKYRNAAFEMSLSIPGTEVALRWINYFTSAIPAAKPEIIEMLGIRGDESAIPLVTASLTDLNAAVRVAASEAIIKINGDKSINSLINYLLVFTGTSDQEAAQSALMKVLNKENLRFLIPVLKEGPPVSKISAIQLLAWSKDSLYFSEVFPLVTSEDEKIKAASVKALISLASSGDQEKLIKLLSETDNQNYIADIQSALISAAGKTPDPEMRSFTILKALQGNVRKGRIIPVLAVTGGKEALSFVFKEFENGNPEIRDISFKALINWSDYSASTVLFSICASGNKTFEGPAFGSFVMQIRSAPLTDEEKLLQFRKIMPYALNANRKKNLLTETGKLKTYQAFCFAAQYLDDPEVSSTAAKAVMLTALPSLSNKAGIYGTHAKEILNRAVEKIAGLEIIYDKELINNYIAGLSAREGFIPLFNGIDLKGWSVKDGILSSDGIGNNLRSTVEYENFEMLLDLNLKVSGNLGIFLNGLQMIQISDSMLAEPQKSPGSEGNFNNKRLSKPVVVIHDSSGEWKSLRVVKINKKISVWLNGNPVASNVSIENLVNFKNPDLIKGSIELQSNIVGQEFRDIFIRSISEDEYNLTPEEISEGFFALFNGRNLDGWIGATSFQVKDKILIIPTMANTQNILYTQKEYSDFIFRFEFLLAPESNSGLAIRTQPDSKIGYDDILIQLLDDSSPVYRELQAYEYNGSVFGVLPAKREYLKPVGEWNSEEVRIRGSKLTVTLNGTEIVDRDLEVLRVKGTMDHLDHPGLKNTTGHIGFIGKGTGLQLRNIRIKSFK